MAEPKLILTTASTVEDHPRYLPDRDGWMSVAGGFTVAVAGEVVMTRPVGQLDDPAGPPPCLCFLLAIMGRMGVLFEGGCLVRCGCEGRG